MLNQFPTTSTGSVKFTVMLASRGALTPLLRGSVLNTAGPISTIGAVRRGLGTPVAKSFWLLSVSVVPLFRWKMAVVLLGAGAFAVSAQFAVAPYPTKSMMLGSPSGQVPSSASKLFTSATLPVVALMLISPTILAGGKDAPTAPPDASAIR